MSSLSRTVTRALLLAALPLPLTGQLPSDAAMRVDEVFARWNSNTSAGCAVGVTLDGLTVLERAYGMADLEHDIANTPETIFEGGSVSKQFTAAAIVLLVLDGKLSLDDDVRTYVPEVPNYGPTITLHHMLTHTSGLRDWGSVASISGWGREQRSHTHDHVLDIVSRQSSPHFVPGHQYSYSNTGYNLLAIVVARVSGMSFADFSRQRIFEPLGLKSTQWRDDYRRIVKGRSTAYDAQQDGTWAINRPIEFVHGNGGILTTVRDLGIWNQALTEERFGSDFTRMMSRRGVLNDGSRIVYAGGLQFRNFMGVPSITHTGSTAGYRAFLGRYPEQGLSVAMLCNASNAPTGGNGTRIARIFLGDAVRAPATPAGVQLAEGILRSFAGLYRDPVTGLTRSLRVQNGELRDGNATLIPISETRFQLGAQERYYVFETTGATRPSFRIDSWEYSDQLYEPVDAWRPTSSELAQYAGTYSSYDAETTYIVSVEAGRLQIWQRPGSTQALTPIYAGAFRLGGGRVMRFRNDELHLGFGRVFDMVFTRER